MHYISKTTLQNCASISFEHTSSSVIYCIFSNANSHKRRAMKWIVKTSKMIKIILHAPTAFVFISWWPLSVAFTVCYTVKSCARANFSEVNNAAELPQKGFCNVLSTRRKNSVVTFVQTPLKYQEERVNLCTDKTVNKGVSASHLFCMSVSLTFLLL